ncbi:MAG: type III-B CRISPR module RAMP protein Cmr1 [Anaerolineae bacterium]|nr:type III-B CRISPR module RAMP protein Cmr1 [Anaerolineae bacterium]MBL8105211.1 type III-B CRISPR module RAMP protein Cmr1 [Anaerolineales bacterium]MCC7187866.1 type III-B CRISPR module RAMP protein Cmr1 [Anaerolineales bacterium]
MSRKLPEKNPPVVNKEVQKPGWVIEIRKYKVITPLFGGGEEPQRPDSLTTIRATEVRGHLRFWWRATRGGGFDGNLAAMKKREEEIWGSPAEENKPGPSKVHVRVVSAHRGKASGNDVGQPGSAWSYVAFPLREDELPVYEDASFELEIKYKNVDNINDDVEAALWAWETFGGIGGRTRRGFGALQCEAKKDSADGSWQKIDPPARNQVDKNFFTKHLLADGVWHPGVPHLTTNSRMKWVTKTDNASEVWESLFTALKEFRQKRYKGEFGLSQWPEANEIRRLFNKEINTPENISGYKHVENRFPRAKFGLPIQYNMHHDEDLPEDIKLQGILIDDKKSIDRLASPLILRPIACSDGAVGLAAILEWETVESSEMYTPPGGLVLSGVPNHPSVVSDVLESEVAYIPPLGSHTDVLQAFLDSLK